jgi:methylisocitrate lyase
MRAAMGAASRALDALAAEGTLESQVPSMQTRAELYELIDYPGYARFDAGVYDFTLEG